MKKDRDKRKAYATPELEEVDPAHALSYQQKSLDMEIFRYIDGEGIESMAERYGTPLYVISEKRLREDYIRVLRSFVEYYPDTVAAYSYKTNYLSAICAILREEGAWAEVVSGFEYRIARDLGIPGSNIIFNGPWKTDDELGKAFDEGALVNLDSFSELDRVEEISKRKKRKLKVGVRVNFKLNYPPWAKFGFNAESGQAFDACRRIKECEYLELSGFHVHAGTFILDLDVYEKSTRSMIELANRVRNELGQEPEYFDIGGGYASSNTLHAQFLRGETTTPPIEEYARAIGGTLGRYADSFNKRPVLFIEPGRAVVDPCMSLLTRVVAVKSFPNGEKGVILDAGVNLLSTAYWYKHEVELSTKESRPIEEVNILGALCMNIDVLRRKARLPALKVGDILRFKNVGAYNFSQSLQFIFPRPRVILIGPDKTEIVRLAEDERYIRRLERLPEHLSNEESRNSVLPRPPDSGSKQS